MSNILLVIVISLITSFATSLWILVMFMDIAFKKLDDLDKEYVERMTEETLKIINDRQWR